MSEERRTTPVELLWDLVFVFAITQVTSLIAHDLSWANVGRGLLVLALVWWAWSAFVWATNASDPDSAVLRAVLLVATVLIFVCGLVLPRAWEDQAVLFVVAYAGVRFMHLGLYADVSRRGNASWSAIAGFGAAVVAGMALLLAGALVHNHVARALLWTAAAAIDYAGPAWLTRERLRGLQQVAVAHFAERYGLFVIICLGESIVANGLGADEEDVTAALIAGVVFSVATTIGLWWAYFDVAAGEAEDRLRAHDDPVLAAADSYSYLHLVLVAGIIVFSVGVKAVVHDVHHELADGARLALCGGVALFLAGHAAFRLRLVHAFSGARLVGALAALALWALSAHAEAWVVAGALALVVAAVCVWDRRPAGQALSSGR
jgi:low temperature requirement protein LtrA